MNRRKFLKNGIAGTIVVVVGVVGGFLAFKGSPASRPAINVFTFNVRDEGERWAFVMNGQENPPLTVDVGDTVEITFANDGQFGHTWNLDGNSPSPYQISIRTNPGETETLRFVADASGTFTYYCAVPGHRGLGMQGEINVI